jgi:transglutaminase-like putative cysteine protease
MKLSIKGVCAVLFFLLGIEISAQTFPRLETDPKALEYARRAERNGGYSWTDLAEISLWASGVVQAGKSSALEQIRAAAAELKSSPELPAPGRERAEYILTFMHKKFLKSYSLYQTRVDTLLSGGKYNCVSSAALYMILARSAGLDVSGVMTRDHAFAEVHVNGEDIDVETTNPYGFDPGSRREFHDQFGKLTGFAYVPARNYRDRAAISPIELVSLILSNRIAELESRNRFAEAVPLAIDRVALLEGKT